MQSAHAMDRWIWSAAGFAAACILFSATKLLAAEPGPPVSVRQAFSEKLPNVPGKTLTGVVVTYAPGGKSTRHAHAGSVYAFAGELAGNLRRGRRRPADHSAC